MKRSFFFLFVFACFSTAFATTRPLGSWGGQGSGAGQFESPLEVATDLAGNVYVADHLNHRIQKFDSNGTFLRTWGWGVQDGSNTFQICTAGCQAGIAGGGIGQFNEPAGIAVDASGNVFVSETGNERAQKFDGSGNPLSLWGSPGQGAGQFNDPWSLATDSSGNVYVADIGNARIQKFDGNGVFQRMWGWGVQNGSNVFQICTSGCQTGIHGAGDGQFQVARNVATDPTGSVYVGDTDNHRIQKFDSNGTFVRMWGWGVQDGSNVFQICTAGCQAGIPGTGDGQFLRNHDLAVGPSGDILATDPGNNRIQQFDTDGNFEGKFSACCAPIGIAWDRFGNAYVAAGQHEILKFGPGFFVLDARGGVHAGAGAAAETPPAPYFGFDIARDLELASGYYVVDGFGGLHAGGGAGAVSPLTPYFGFDIARDLELSGAGIHVLDGFGGLHTGGGAGAINPATPYFGFDAAMDLELATTGAYVLDRFGGLHAGGGAPPLSPATPYFGFDIARDLELAQAGFYVLDGFGGIHAGGGAPVLSPTTLYFGFDIANDMELGITGFYVLDGFGGIHPGGGALPVSPSTPYFGFAVAEDLEIG